MAEKRDKRVYIRLTQDEKSRLEALAQKYGHSVSELVRKKLLRPNAFFLDQECRSIQRELLKNSRKIVSFQNLYHLRIQENAPFLARQRKFVKRTQ